MERSPMFTDWQNKYGENVMLLKANYRLNCNIHKILLPFSTDVEKSILKCIWKPKRPQIVKEILSKKSNVRGITISDFKLYYKAIITKITCFWHKINI
jgi:hypothetical protein